MLIVYPTNEFNYAMYLNLNSIILRLIYFSTSSMHCCSFRSDSLTLLFITQITMFHFNSIDKKRHVCFINKAVGH